MKYSTRDEIIAFTNDYLNLHDFKDYGPNGLQFTGTFFPAKIATAVSVSAQVIEQAAAWGADMLFTHHGLWWNNESRELDQRTKSRIDLAQKYNISILGYHLCLDAHPIIGNNILLAKRLHLHELEAFGEIGWGGISSYRDIHSILSLCPGNSQNFFFGPKIPKKIAVIAGGAPQYLTQAYKEGYDTFVTGEAAEFTIYQAQELKMNFIAAGHHQTEKAGICVLGEKLSQEFNLEHKFFDVFNPI